MARKGVLVTAGIVHQYVQATVAGKDFSHRLFPGIRPRHIQRNAKTTAKILISQFVGLLTMGVNPKARCDSLATLEETLARLPGRVRHWHR